MTLDGADLRDAIAFLDGLRNELISFAPPAIVESMASRAEETANGLRLQYCTACGRISEDCSADPCDEVEAEREEI